MIARSNSGFVVRKTRSLSKGNCFVKEPGLDNRHRDKDGKIQQKRGDTLNKNLPIPIDGFSPNTRLDTMREKTEETSIDGVRNTVRNLKNEE